MRWYHIDRFVEFVSGQRAVSIKTVSLTEDHIHDYWPGYPIFPSTLIVEGLAQTGGLLVGEMVGFERCVILAKVSRATFHELAVPGDRLTYTATLETQTPEGAIIKGTSHKDDILQAEINLVFGFIPERMEGVQQFYPADFLATMRKFGMFDVLQTPEGEPKLPPAFMLEAEKEALESGMLGD
jgi:3-hydroxyacyl-[acyl-carrier-protein] dehydratase